MLFSRLGTSSFLSHSFNKPCLHVLVLVLCMVRIPDAQAQLPAGFIRERIATGLNPTSAVLAPDGRVFITEKNGIIRIIRDDQLLEEVFLMIEVDDSYERGLGHMILDPDFEHNGYYYVFYTVPGLRHNRVSRFTANGDHTIPGSEKIILELDEVGGGVHNGGDMVFGFDGYLYISTGDGGQNWRGEDLGSTNGKILRIDTSGNPVPDNPWYNLQYLRANLVYAYGFRNPFTMTIHPITGEIFANDVGGSKYEEVNKVERGAFYGWPVVEGKRTAEVVPSEYIDPFFQYGHTNNYCAIVGSAFYVPEIQQFPEQYAGRYFYSDYCTGKMRMLDPENGIDRGVFISDGDRVIDIDIDAKGSLYYLERKGLGDGSPEDNTGTTEGTLWKVSFTGSGAPFISVQPQSVLHAVGEDAVFSIIPSGAQPMTYAWSVDDDVLDTLNSTSLVLNDVGLSQDSIRIGVEVTNEFGSAVSEDVFLRVTDNHRPEPLITSPDENTTYSAGISIHFSGIADDNEDGDLPESALSWKIDFHHGTHVHPALSWTSGISSGDWVVPSIGETSTDVWYRIYLKATDSRGFSKVVYRDVFPERGKIFVSSSTAGLVIHLDGAPVQTPFEVSGVNGISRYLTPPHKQIKGDSVYLFRAWENGSTQLNREVSASEINQSLKGYFDAIPNGKGKGLTISYYDNTQFAGPPVAVDIDPVPDHQYLLQSPFPGVPDDNFGIVWKGYIQPYRTGTYQFSAISDDGAFVEIDGQVIIQNWEPGSHHETGSVFLQAGRLYPIHIRMYEFKFGAQLRLSWSSADFPQEVIPTSQLYPVDYLSAPEVSAILLNQTVTGDDLILTTESYKDMLMDFKISTMAGITLDYPGIWVGIGKNTIDISMLAPGLYYLQGVERGGSESLEAFFVKVR